MEPSEISREKKSRIALVSATRGMTACEMAPAAGAGFSSNTSFMTTWSTTLFSKITLEALKDSITKIKVVTYILTEQYALIYNKTCK
jgi:hypothetical protein